MEGIECKTCKEVFPQYEGHFIKQKSNRSGYTLDCKACRNIAWKEYRNRTVEQRRIYQQNYTKTVRRARKNLEKNKELNELSDTQTRKHYKSFEKILKITGKMHNELYGVDPNLSKNNSWMEGKERHSLIEAGLYENPMREFLTNKIINDK